MNKVKTLGIVDDDKIYTFLIKKTIEQTNLVDMVKIFDNGLNALNFLKKNAANHDSLPEIILLDLSMPIMDGWQFIEEYANIKTEIKKKVVIVMWSSSVNPINIERASKISEISKYIIKPMKLEEVKMVFDDFESLCFL